MNARGISERVSRGVEVRAPLEKGFLQQVRDQGGLFPPDRKPVLDCQGEEQRARFHVHVHRVATPLHLRRRRLRQSRLRALRRHGGGGGGPALAPRAGFGSLEAPQQVGAQRFGEV